jgi:ornithine cyclodeaminase/alanine dehydrogenase
LPGINGGIMLLDSETGELRAVMDANWVTAVRTSGLSAVVAKRLANPESSSIAFVGCGVQARSHLDAFAELFPISEIRAFGRGSTNVKKLCNYAKQRGFKSSASSTAQEALEGADIVVSSITLSYDVEPFLDAVWMKPGAFAVITDLALPWKSENMNTFSKVIIDDKVQEAAMEKPMVDPGLITGDMKDLIDGSLTVSYQKDEKAAFVFRGLALGDFAVAAMAYARATLKA